MGPALVKESFFVFMFQFREKRIEQEKELIQKQNTWLSDELKMKTDELVQLRKEKVIKIAPI